MKFVAVKDVLSGHCSVNEATKKYFISNRSVLRNEYNRLHKKYGFMKSLSRVSRCLGNQPIERFCGTYKSQSYYITKHDTYEDVLQDVTTYIRYYNNYRYTECLGGLSPNEYRRDA